MSVFPEDKQARHLQEPSLNQEDNLDINMSISGTLGN